MMVHRVTFSLTCFALSTSSCMANGRSASTMASANGFPSQAKLLALVQPAPLALHRTVHGIVLCVLPSLLQNNMLCSKPYKYSVALLRRENAVMNTGAYSATWGM